MKRRLAIRFAKLMRWLHIYLSMFGLAAVLFFSVTGITLNHPALVLFGVPLAAVRPRERWISSGSGPPAETASASTGQPPADRQSGEVAKLEIVEHLRKAHAIGGALAEFRVDETECLVSFKGPGYAADAFIDRESGRYRLTETYDGFIAVINDLHQGRHTGPVWCAVIDLSAALMTLISLSGLVLACSTSSSGALPGWSWLWRAPRSLWPYIACGSREGNGGSHSLEPARTEMATGPSVAHGVG